MLPSFRVVGRYNGPVLCLRTELVWLESRFVQPLPRQCTECVPGWPDELRQRPPDLLSGQPQEKSLRRRKGVRQDQRPVWRHRARAIQEWRHQGRPGIKRHLGVQKAYLPLCKVVDTSLTLKVLKYLLYKPKDQRPFQFEIIITVLVSSFRFIWIPMLWVYGHYKYFTLSARGSI